MEQGRPRPCLSGSRWPAGSVRTAPPQALAGSRNAVVKSRIRPKLKSWLPTDWLCDLGQIGQPLRVLVSSLLKWTNTVSPDSWAAVRTQ